MTGIRPKRPRIRLEAGSYKQLWRRVLERDNWTCQICGSKQNLQVHHKKLRSRQGGDLESNLISLCSNCHDRLHNETD
jgi:5-methylcytosine-specific restriction endonuclease McrA